MPINGMMTLSDVVDAGIQGNEWKQQQDERARVEKQRAAIDGANKAAAGVIDASKAEWAINGAQGTYQPNDATMFRAALARSQALAKAGMWPEFMEDQARVQQQRMRVRSAALQQFEQDGDPEKLARSFYPTIPDGKDIVSTEVLAGGDPKAPLGAPRGPSQLRIKYNDGSTDLIEPGKLAARIKLSLVDPAAQAEKDAQLAFLKAQEAVKGEEERKTKRVEGEERRRDEEQKAKHSLQQATDVANINNTGALQRSNVAAGATVQAARIGADGRVQAATIAAGAKGGDSDKSDKGLQINQKWATLAKDHFGKISGGLMGSSRMSDQATLDLGIAAQKIHEANKGRLTELQALDQAAKLLKLKSPAPGLAGLEDATN